MTTTAAPGVRDWKYIDGAELLTRANEQKDWSWDRAIADEHQPVHHIHPETGQVLAVTIKDNDGVIRTHGLGVLDSIHNPC